AAQEVDGKGGVEVGVERFGVGRGVQEDVPGEAGLASPALDPQEELGGGDVWIAGLARRLGGLAREEDPAAAEEHQAAAREARPARDPRHFEAGKPGERLEALAAHLDEEGDE